jgi:hypothetical protein
MSKSKSDFARYFDKLEKLQTWIVDDLTRATINAQANFLVAMGVFNYIEILDGFCTPGGSVGKIGSILCLRSSYPHHIRLYMIN